MDFKFITVSLCRFLKLMRAFSIPYSEYQYPSGRCFYGSLPVGGIAYKTRIFKSHSHLVSSESRFVDTMLNSL